jgi:DNA-binding transcriptional MerR regulator
MSDYYPTRQLATATKVQACKNLPTTLAQEQILAAEALLARRGGRPSLEQIALQVGVSDRTLRRWRTSDDFISYLRVRSLQELSLSLPQITASLAERAESGSAKHAEIAMKMLGLLSQQVDVNVTPVMPEERSNAQLDAELDQLKTQLAQTQRQLPRRNEEA